jgi:hypothetical protein
MIFAFQPHGLLDGPTTGNRLVHLSRGGCLTSMLLGQGFAQLCPVPNEDDLGAGVARTLLGEGVQSEVAGQRGRVNDDKDPGRSEHEQTSRGPYCRLFRPS